MSRYKFTIHFRGGRSEICDADGYATSNGVFQLFTHTPHMNAKVKIFPMVEIMEINMEDASA